MQFIIMHKCFRTILVPPDPMAPEDPAISTSCRLAIQLAACRSLNISGKPVPAPCNVLFEIPGVSEPCCNDTVPATIGLQKCRLQNYTILQQS